MIFFQDKSIVTFTARNANSVGAVLALDKLMETTSTPHAAIFEIDLENATELSFLDYSIVGIAIDPPGGTRLVLLDELGEVLILDDGNIENERIDLEEGPLRQLRLIDNTLFAVGTAGQVYRKDPGQPWKSFGPERLGPGNQATDIFSDIDGFSADDLYVAATNGAIWHWSGKNWSVINCHTNLAFLAIECAEDGQVYACGQTGILARGRDLSFELITPDGALSDLWGIQFFKGTLYCTSYRALLQLGENGLEPCMPAMDVGHTFYGLDQAEGVLWALGEKDVLRFDGEVWTSAQDLEWVMP